MHQPHFGEGEQTLRVGLIVNQLRRIQPRPCRSPALLIELDSLHHPGAFTLQLKDEAVGTEAEDFDLAIGVVSY